MKNFAFQTKTMMICDNNNESHVTTEENHFIFKVEVQESKNVIGMQILIDFALSQQTTSKDNTIDCEHCKKCHSATKIEKIQDLKNNTNLIIQIKRFDFNIYTLTRKKINTPIDISSSVVIYTVWGGYTVFNPKSSLNHIGNTAESGHYNTTVTFDDQLWICDDIRIDKQIKLDGRYAYNVLYE
ncbi:MAG: hypothetical protein GY938_22800, partial [Ketobacter sp.]|nr:hypothetical protein [Ketobacter sp.]